MEPTEKDLDNLNTPFGALRLLSKKGDSIFETTMDSFHKIKEAKHAHSSFGNILQLERFADIISKTDVYPDAMYDDFMCGAMVAFLIQEKNGGEAFRTELYKALNALFYLAKDEAYNTQADEFETLPYEQVSEINARHEPLGKKQLGQEIRTILETSLVFFDIDDDEEVFLQDLVVNAGGDKDNEYVVIQGYRFIRMATEWYKDYLAGVNSEKSKVIKDTFSEVVAAEKFEDRRFEGLELCTDDLEALNKKLDDYQEELSDEEMTVNADEDLDVFVDVLREKLFEDFITMKKLTINDRVTIVGNTFVKIFNKNNAESYSLDIDDTSTIYGMLVDFDIVRVPGEPTIEEANDHDLIRYSLSFKLDNLKIVKLSGEIIATTSSETPYIAIDGVGTQIWREPSLV